MIVCVIGNHAQRRGMLEWLLFPFWSQIDSFLSVALRCLSSFFLSLCDCVIGPENHEKKKEKKKKKKFCSVSFFCFHAPLFFEKEQDSGIHRLSFPTYLSFFFSDGPPASWVQCKEKSFLFFWAGCTLKNQDPSGRHEGKERMGKGGKRKEKKREPLSYLRNEETPFLFHICQSWFLPRIFLSIKRRKTAFCFPKQQHMIFLGNILL
mmetsp:Transcript_6160/g.15159  ORF Transcript_6160/g.15159 Transcript_6160/m.15159 type:complete len:207 (-) Transcript_6160:3165-3785(-)